MRRLIIDGKMEVLK